MKKEQAKKDFKGQINDETQQIKIKNEDEQLKYTNLQIIGKKIKNIWQLLFWIRQKKTSNQIKNFQLQLLPEIVIDQDIKNHANEILKHKKLKKNQIELYWIQMNSLHLIHILRESLKNKIININNIKIFKLSSNRICDDGIQQLCRRQYKLIKLQKLQLQWNNITMKGVQYISKGAERKQFPQLTTLWLFNNNIGNNKNFQEQQQKQQGILLRFANDNTKLRQLRLYYNQINDDDMTKLFKFEQNQQTNNSRKFNYLQALQLSYNKITKNGIKEFARQLKQKFPSLRGLGLSGNQVKVDGVKYLVGFSNINLTISHKLQILSLTKSDLCLQAIKILVKNKFYSLKQLYINHNPLIKDQGFNYIIKAYREGTFPLLQQLKLSCIDLSNNGIENIIKKFQLIAQQPFQKIILKDNQKLIDLKFIQKKLSKRFKPQVKVELY